MSTRCEIGIFEKRPTADELMTKWEVLLYRHSDGYPGTANGKEYGVLPDIIPLLQKFKDNARIDDCVKVGARLIQHLCNLHDNHMAKIDAKMGYTHDGINDPTMLGYGITKEFYCDIEYFYAICPDCIDVYETQCEGISPADFVWEFKLIKTVKLKSRGKYKNVTL